MIMLINQKNQPDFTGVNDMEWWKILGIVIVVLILFLLGYLFFQENPQKYYRKARKTHRKGERAYASGNYEVANSHYVKADDYRKRARELE
ncbi:hypothetical protein EXS74_00830 [Candidatus Woesearchaeota archaeon]|nr:hypothetical protein [Candidatus Woesearchaeota archaeon]